ncbi:probable chitinase 2 [Orussus abietinus]|uniref:probable chitinase 2 n=1 Tax=Orussus abietinus TaxID=222816 RepID=UPI0006266F01|nr:probable chitinase 2 [Orussus abietinus]
MLPIIAALAVLGGQGARGLLNRPAHEKVVSCYVTSWAAYRPGKGQFGFDELRPEHCTHLIYAFAGLNATTSTIVSLDPWADFEENYGKGTYRKMTGLRRQFPGLKVTLAIGGWNEGSANYSALAASPERRNTFVNSVVEFLKMYDFDGLDLDWEFPAKRGGAPHDKENFVHLIRELHHAFEGRGLILTAAIGADKSTIDMSYDIPEMSKYLDFIHVMAYDYHGSWDKRVLPNAPLHSKDDLSVEESITYLLKKGAPPSKLVVGLPMYGRTFVLVSPLSSGESPIGAPSLEKGFPGPFTRENGFMGYNEVCRELSNRTKEWINSWDDESQTAYAVNGDKVVVYDNPKSIRAKIDFVAKLQLAGVMVWSIDTDDFRGECSTLHDFLTPLKGFTYPLMRAINQALEAPAEKFEDNVVDVKKSSAGSLFALNSVLVMSLYAGLL